MFYSWMWTDVAVIFRVHKFTMGAHTKLYSNLKKKKNVYWLIEHFEAQQIWIMCFYCRDPWSWRWLLFETSECRGARNQISLWAQQLECWTVAALRCDCVESCEYKAGGYWKGARRPPRINNENTESWDSSSMYFGCVQLEHSSKKNKTVWVWSQGRECTIFTTVSVFNSCSSSYIQLLYLVWYFLFPKNFTL